MDEIRQTIDEVLEKAPVLSLATSLDDQPWIAVLLFVHDEDLNLYWLSHDDTRHSRELVHNSRCAISVTIIDEACRGKSLQISGRAQIVIDMAEKQAVHDKYHQRHHEPKHRTREDAQAEMEKFTLYKFTPTTIKVINEVDWGHERREYNLK